jgi:hypothetical protein
MRRSTLISCRLVATILFLGCFCRDAGTTEISVNEDRFLVDGEPKFLLGCSYYGALGAPDEILHADLDEMQTCGFNWIRVWATWAAFENDVSAVDRSTGKLRPQYLRRLRGIVRECDRRRMIVNVTLSRGNGVTGKERLQDSDAQHTAVEALLNSLNGYANWYLDLSNERNISDNRFTSFEDLAELRKLAKEIDNKRLVTASHAGDAPKNEVIEYIQTVGVDFLSIHRPREANSPGDTEAKTRQYIRWMREASRVRPLHYDEPFRRGFGRWEPTAEDYWTDLLAAEKGGAAGWCFHNGDQRGVNDGRPRRSFDLREKRLFEQLDGEERKFIEMLKRRAAEQ